MGPDLICVGVELFSQNTSVKTDEGDETVTRENMIVMLTEAKPADGQLVKSSVTLVYKNPPWPIFEKDAIYTSDLKKKSLVSAAVSAPAPTPAPPAPSAPTPGLTSTPNPEPLGGSSG